jgi:dTDP-4-amino-4,6-dideoxygalactose transaminase
MADPTDPIYVTRPFLPPIEEFLPYLREMWESRILTNNGPFHERLEGELSRLFDDSCVSLVNNGTQALSVALSAAGVVGEVITTPYSFVATTHAARLGGLEPVFVDIKPGDLNIDPAAVEAAITPRTSAILAVHCYGFPCDTDALRTIANRHGLALIYDAAHAFGVTKGGRSVLKHGDYSTLSFHATKSFNTFEGGAVVSPDAPRKALVDSLRNFGILDEVTVASVGTNSKMSEFNAALGLVQLGHFEEVRAARREIHDLYLELLAGVAGIACFSSPADVALNHTYFPILVGDAFPASRDEVYRALGAEGIHCRRYFYPLLSSHRMYADLPSAAAGNLPVASRAAGQILCLPIYPGLATEAQHRIVDTLQTLAATGAGTGGR